MCPLNVVRGTCSAFLVSLLQLSLVACEHLSVELKTPHKIYSRADEVYRITVWADLNSPLGTGVQHTLDVWVGFDAKAMSKAWTSSPVPPFPKTETIAMTIPPGSEGIVSLTAVFQTSTSSMLASRSERTIRVLRLEPLPGFVGSSSLHNEHREDLATHDPAVVELVEFAVEEYAIVQQVQYSSIVRAFKTSDLSTSERYWLTVRTAGSSTGFFTFSVVVTNSSLALKSASSVNAQIWAVFPPRPFPASLEDGVCDHHEPSIDVGLAPWESGGAHVLSTDVKQVSVANNKVCWQHVWIVNNSLYMSELDPKDLQSAQSKSPTKWYTIALIESLLFVLQRFSLPDLEFCCSEEAPQVLRGNTVVSMSMTSTRVHMDIRVPDYFFRYWSPSVPVPHQWYQTPRDHSVYAATEAPAWHQRIPKLYWRGTVSSWLVGGRGTLVRASYEYPHLIDAKALRMTPRAARESFKGSEDIFLEMQNIGLQGQHTNDKEILRYKFVIATHGPAIHWSNRFRSLLSTGALVFKQIGDLTEFWEYELEPFVHYIPLREDLSDLLEMVEWAVENDEEAQAIALNGFHFVRERLRPERVVCYWGHLLHRYGALLDYVPTVDREAVQYTIVNAYL